MRSVLTAFVFAFGLLAVGGASADKLDPENTIYLDLKQGRVVIQLLPELAPGHVKRFKTLTREGFYNGNKFHRVIAGFMAQTGDPTGTGAGASDYHDLKAEFTNKAKFERGTVGMARGPHPDSANSQFFINFRAYPSLNGKYTIFGKVVKGMKYVDRIKKGDPETGPVSGKPDVIVKIQVAADVK